MAVAVFKVFTKHSIKLVPVLGPYLEFSFDLVDEVTKELKSSPPEELSPSEISLERVAGYLRGISPAEANAVIDSELDTPEAKTSTVDLTDQQKVELRRRLVLIPFEADRIMAEIEVRERARAEEAGRRAVEAAREAGETREREREKAGLSLRERLKEQLASEQYNDAARTVEELMRWGYKSPELLRIEAFVRRRAKWNYGNSCLLTLLLFPVTFAVAASIFDAYRLANDTRNAIGALIMLLLFVFTMAAVPVLWRGLSRWRIARRALYWTAIVIAVAGPFAAYAILRMMGLPAASD